MYRQAKRFLPAIVTVVICGTLSAAPQGQLRELVVTVRDAAGKLVAGLNTGDFILEENEKTQTITKFSSDIDTPVSFGILLDVSESMRPYRPVTVSAIQDFVSFVKPQD